MKTHSPSTEAVWRERVRAWRASGETAAQFARGREFTVASLRTWSSRVRRTEAPEFLRLVPRAPSPAAAPSSALVLEVGGVPLRVAPGFDPVLLTQVVAALRAGAR